MPELPEVETIARHLRGKLAGEVITAVSIKWAGSIAVPSASEFSQRLKGCRIQTVSRRGKFLIFRLSHLQAPRRRFLLVHLRMSGRLEVTAKNFAPTKHDHVVFEFRSGRKLRFHDTRKFGRMFLPSKAQALTGKLGVEPMDRRFTSAKLKELLGRRRSAIKSLLLDQSLIAGIGNIYADESLWQARIHPLRRACDIKAGEMAALHRAIRTVLGRAIRAQGTDAGDGVVYWGRYQPRVYGRENEKCRRCKNTIQRIVVGQRGTHFCPACQPLPGGRHKVILNRPANNR